MALALPASWNQAGNAALHCQFSRPAGIFSGFSGK
jgi:hypothetical protein